MSSSNIFRLAGIAGILSAAVMAVMSFGSDPSQGIPPLLAIVSAVLGILLVTGLYLLYRGEAPALSLAAAVISGIGYVLWVVASLMQLKFPSPLLAAADIAIYILGLALFSWLAYRTRKMSRILAAVGLLAALAGAGSYLYMAITGATVTSMENLPPVLMTLFLAYLIFVIVWLTWTGISLLRMKPAAATVQTPSAAVDLPA